MPQDQHEPNQTWLIRSLSGEFLITRGTNGGEGKPAARVPWSLVLADLGRRRHSLFTRGLFKEMYEVITGCRFDLHLRRNSPEQEQLIMERRLAEAFQNGQLVALRSSPEQRRNAQAQRTGDSSAEKPNQGLRSDENNRKQSRPEEAGSLPSSSGHNFYYSAPKGRGAKKGEDIFVTAVKLVGPSQFKHDMPRACCGWVEFKVTGYTRPVKDEDKKQIKWLVRLEGGKGAKTTEVPMAGGKDSLLIEPIPQEWEGKTIHAYAYFHSPSNDARASALVETSGAFQLEDGPSRSVGRFIQLMRKVEATHPELSTDEVLGALRRLHSPVNEASPDFNYDSFHFRRLFGVLDRPPALRLEPKGSLSEHDIKELREIVPHEIDEDHPYPKYDKQTGQKLKGMFVQEYGVVHDVRRERVAVGHVVTGLAAGLRRNKKFRFAKDTWETVSPVVVLQTPVPVVVPVPRELPVPFLGEPVDNLYAATISGDLGQSACLAWEAVQQYREAEERKNLQKGSILSYSPGPPFPGDPLYTPPALSPSQADLERETEKQLDAHTGHWATSESTSAELVGDIDGFLMGENLDSNSQDKLLLCQPGGRKFSEILHEYYCVFANDCENDSSDRFMQFAKTDRDELRKQVKAFAATYAYRNGSVPDGINNQAEYSTADKMLNRFWKWLDSKIAQEKKKRLASL